MPAVTFSFGVFDHLDRRDAPIGEIYESRLRLLERYDSAGFHAFHLAEHHGTPLGLAPSPSVFLAAIAQRTKRLRFGPLVYTLPQYDPLRLIEEICMLDHMSGGRLELGVGRGISPFELAYFNVPHLESPAIYQDALEVLMKGLTNDRLTHRGPYFQYHNVPMELRPLQQPHPPLWYGIGTGGSIEWQVQNSVNAVSNAPCAAIAPVLRRYRERWQAVRPADPLPKLGIARHLLVAETDAEADRIAAPAYAAWFNSFAKAWREFGANPVRYPPEFEAARKTDIIITGSPATVRAEMERQIAGAGVNYFVCRFSYGNLTYEQAAASLELFVNEVMGKVSPPAAAAVA